MRRYVVNPSLGALEPISGSSFAADAVYTDTTPALPPLKLTVGGRGLSSSIPGVQSLFSADDGSVCDLPSSTPDFPLASSMFSADVLVVDGHCRRVPRSLDTRDHRSVSTVAVRSSGHFPRHDGDC